MTPVTDEELIARALAARARAHAPYSRFRVGAAVVAGAQVFDGANVENASYGLSICAERNAVAQAVLAGARELQAIAVATETSPPASPCGMCLQTMVEFAPDPRRVRVLLANAQGERRSFALAELLPHAFRPVDLDRGDGGE